MSLTISFAENGHVIVYTFGSNVSWDEVTRAQTEVTTWFDKAPGKVHMLMDLRGLETLPGMAVRARSNPELTHRNAGNIAIVGGSTFVQVMGETIVRLARNKKAKFFKADEIEQAWQYLREAVTNESGPAGHMAAASWQ